MEIREYRPEDCSEMASLFYDTVHTVNAADYTKEQLDAWADGAVDCEAWDHSFREHYTLVAIEDGKLAGFGDMDESGYLDRLYIHKDFQKRGIAAALCDRLEKRFAVPLTAFGPFFLPGQGLSRPPPLLFRAVLVTIRHLQRK